ncbi:MAG: hypothetical protein IT176_10285 [Acidobacteria bacterium]|nr:hypothetical protein [Acidobacteriota bacterium]
MLLLQSPPPVPAPPSIIVKLIEPPDTRIADIITGALGISGAIALAALAIGLLVGGLMFWLRSRAS